jgi:hypothetical protein
MVLMYNNVDDYLQQWFQTKGEKQLYVLLITFLYTKTSHDKIQIA